MSRKVLDEAEIGPLLSEIGGWALAEDGKSIARRFVFANFNAAFGFMTRVALIAEKMDHHPDWSNVYKTVDVKLSTHDAGGITELDLELARRMNRVAGI